MGPGQIWRIAKALADPFSASHRAPRKAEQRAGEVRVQSKSQTGEDTAERIKSILETRALTLYQVSQKSEAAYGHASPYSLPHNLYYDLKLGIFSPSVYQLFALSRISNYRLVDWLRVFGFDLEDIPWLQLLIPTNRTILLDSSLSDPSALIPWFRDKARGTPIPPAAPLSQLLEAGPPTRQGSLLQAHRQQFLYAKIGLEDALAFPDLLPGSIVRVDPRVGWAVAGENRTHSNRLFLVEHGKGLYCCRLLAAGANRVLTVSTHLPYPQIELQLQREARVLGALDLEIRSLIRVEQPKVSVELAKRWKPIPLARGNVSLSQLLRSARLRAALSLREASALSRRIATEFGDERYFMSPSSLSDYEARDTPPRHFQKVATLCLVYAVPLHTFLSTVGVPAEKAGKESIPDRFIPRVATALSHDGGTEHRDREDKGFLGELLRRCEEVPAFLRGAIAEISGLASPSLRSFFWIGGVGSSVHPYLANGLIVSVDRRRKKPVDSRSQPPWQQALYIVLKRNGSYFCGPCGMENGTLVIHPDRENLDLREQFRYGRDAEVVGQITAVVRRML